MYAFSRFNFFHFFHVILPNIRLEHPLSGVSSPSQGNPESATVKRSILSIILMVKISYLYIECVKFIAVRLQFRKLE